MNPSSLCIRRTLLLAAISLQSACSGDNQVLGNLSVGGNGTATGGASMGIGGNTSGATTSSVSGGAGANQGGSSHANTGGVSSNLGGATTSTGGTPNTGGVSSNLGGATTSTGGKPNTGGVSSNLGGATTVAGAKSTGGAAATGGAATTGGSKATGGTVAVTGGFTSTSSGGTSSKQCPIPTPSPNSNCTLDLMGTVCNLGNGTCELCQCWGLNPGDVLACLWSQPDPTYCPGAGTGGQTSVSGTGGRTSTGGSTSLGGNTSAGGTTNAGGASSTSAGCSALHCASTQICVAYRTEGGAVIGPDANGNCPAGMHVESSNMCANDFAYECSDLTGCSAGAVNCACGAAMCPSNHACSNPFTSVWLDPTASLLCQLLAP